MVPECFSEGRSNVVGLSCRFVLSRTRTRPPVPSGCARGSPWVTMEMSISRVTIVYKQVLDKSDAMSNSGVAMLIVDLFEETGSQAGSDEGRHREAPA